MTRTNAGTRDPGAGGEADRIALSTRVRVLEVAEHLRRARASVDDGDDLAAYLDEILEDVATVEELLATRDEGEANRWHAGDAR